MKQELALKLQNRNWKKKSGCVKWRKCWLASPVTHATCLPSIWRSSAKGIDRHGFTSQPNNGSNSTAQNATWARILVLCPAPLPCTSAWKCTCLAAILCNDKKLSSGSSGGTICMISMWCSGLKSNMQTSYLHISMVTLLPFQVAESTPEGFWNRLAYAHLLFGRGKGSTETVPNTSSTFNFGSQFFWLHLKKLSEMGRQNIQELVRSTAVIQFKTHPALMWMKGIIPKGTVSCSQANQFHGAAFASN